MQCWNHWKITAGHHIKSIYNAFHVKDYWIKWVSERVESMGERASERASERVHSSSVSMTMTLSNKWFFACVNCFDSKNNAKLLSAHNFVWNDATDAFSGGFHRNSTISTVEFRCERIDPAQYQNQSWLIQFSQMCKMKRFFASVNRKLIWVKVIRFAIFLRKSVWSAGYFPEADKLFNGQIGVSIKIFSVN